MTGAILAAFSGMGFGVFQAFNRRASTGFSAYTATFLLMLTSSIVLAIASVLTAPIEILFHAPAIATLNFALAGFFHFVLGWTFISISQNKVGAARTGALMGATPLFATFVAALALDEILRLPVFLGILTVVAGIYMITLSGKKLSQNGGFSWKDTIYGLGVAVCFSISPIFIRAGLVHLESPLLGVTIGMTTTTIAYGILLVFKRENQAQGSVTRDALFFQIAAGVIVGLSTWLRWLALDMTEVGPVMALGRLNVPVVILLSPLLVGQAQERVTMQVWIGGLLVVLGSLLLIFFR